ncbi:hypothetical protein [Lysinibacillus fusiformis]|uniref:hypothetical protein n=1 Tax=Lysinibacillus fusiformis TaxID=28031 RepID=UPI000D39C233|nr:hypothetical protein [Lysinibacillus fusiformis]MED4672382.1 hypothetical protein [Lysinibacillus fusiformis]RDV32223.1 hypothetical protein C7B90_10890 [Lysinibacillus fusiformis]GED65576.1 hypothetical protein LFU01_40280 [Lysinibacillus fusiformis]
MEQFIANATAFLEWAQKPSLICAAIASLIAGYFLMAGGQDGRRTAKNILIGAGVGLLLVNGALALATSVNTNFTF